MVNSRPTMRSSFVHVVQLGKIKTLYYYWEINSREQRIERKRVHKVAEDVQPYGLVDNLLLFNKDQSYRTLDFYVFYQKGEDVVIPVEDLTASAKMIEAIRDCPELYRRINADAMGKIKSLYILILMMAFLSRANAQDMRDDGGKEVPGYVLEKDGRQVPATIQIPKGTGTTPGVHMVWKATVTDLSGKERKILPKDVLGFGLKNLQGDSVHFQTIPTPGWYYSYDRTHCFAALEKRGKISLYKIWFEEEKQRLLDGSGGPVSGTVAINSPTQLRFGPATVVFIYYREQASTSIAVTEPNAANKVREAMADCPTAQVKFYKDRMNTTEVREIVDAYNTQCGW